MSDDLVAELRPMVEEVERCRESHRSVGLGNADHRLQSWFRCNARNILAALERLPTATEERAGFFESVGAALDKRRARKDAPTEGVRDELVSALDEKIANYSALRDEFVETGRDENGYALAVEALEHVRHDISLSRAGEKG